MTDRTILPAEPPAPSTGAPGVTAVIVTYRSVREIGRCLAALDASGMPVSVVVVDNASGDGSADAAEAAGRGMDLRVVRNPTNTGFAKAVNQGIGLSTTDLVLVLNPDCYVRPDTIGRVVHEMQQRARIGMAGCLLLNPDGTEQAGCRRYVPTPWRALIRVLRLHHLSHLHPRFNGFLMNNEPLPNDPITLEAISGAFMLLRREALADVGLLDEGYFMHCEDLDWCMRFRERSWRILFVPGTSAEHDKGRSSNARPLRVEWYKHRGMVRFYLKFFRRRYPGLLLWAVIASVWSRFAIVAARMVLRRAVAPLRRRKGRPPEASQPAR